MIIKVYTDASYYWQRDIAACGYVILNGVEMLKHEVVIVERIHGVEHAEFFSVYNALQHAFLVKEVAVISIFCDSQTVVNFCMGHSGFKRKGVNALVADLLELLGMFKEEKIVVHFHKVKAHSKDHFNTMVDKSSRTHLRKYLKEFS